MTNRQNSTFRFDMKVVFLMRQKSEGFGLRENISVVVVFKWKGRKVWG